ncbi:UNVERIFIED_CONTAM: hypothetical protein HDU68_009851 [Siphonaria sp. JEL0065]|nr:hypothetical protein HDU68_009851 [Siphonaria sp. JEL0065]
MSTSTTTSRIEANERSSMCSGCKTPIPSRNPRFVSSSGSTSNIKCIKCVSKKQIASAEAVCGSVERIAGLDSFHGKVRDDIIALLTKTKSSFVAAKKRKLEQTEANKDAELEIPSLTSATASATASATKKSDKPKKPKKKKVKEDE